MEELKMTVKLTNEKLFVKGEMSDVFEVVVGKIRKDMFLEITIEPNNYSEELAVESESFTVDMLNESIVDVLKEEGYTVIEESQIERIQSQEF